MTTTISASLPRTTLVAAGRDIWRVLDGGGRAVGNVRRRATPGGERFEALRFHPPTRGFRCVGEFWSADDAVATLRYGG